MLLNIVVGVIAYVLLIVINNSKSSLISEKNEFGLVYLDSLKKSYFLNILYIIILCLYSYYVYTNQSGWSMYTMFGLNFFMYFIGFYISDDVETSEEEQ